MDKQDLANRIRGLVKEEVSSVLSERTYKYGGLGGGISGGIGGGAGGLSGADPYHPNY